MYNYEDLNYEINEVFNYMIKHPKGTIAEINDNLMVSKSDILIIVNVFHKSDLIMRYKSSNGSAYILKKQINSISFGKAINLGIDISTLENYFDLENDESLNELTYFIASGKLEQAIEEEENNKKQKFIEDLSVQCKSKMAEMAISDHVENIKKVIAKQEQSDDKNNSSILNLLNEISEELEKEYEQMKNKMIEKKISSLR